MHGDSKEYYLVLGLKTDATKKQIRNAYLLHASAFHTDKIPKGETRMLVFEEKIKLITEANRVLSDDAERGQYDREERNKNQGGAGLYNNNTGNSIHYNCNYELIARNKKLTREIIDLKKDNEWYKTDATRLQNRIDQFNTRDSKFIQEKIRLEAEQKQLIENYIIKEK